MKLLFSVFDDYTKTDTNIYRLDSGITIFESVRADTMESMVSYSTNGGFLSDYQNKIQLGSAHFLEHIIAGRPNNILKTQHKFDNFLKGSSKKPSLYSNAYTAFRNTEYYVSGNKNGIDRMLKFLIAQIHSPEKSIKKYIEKERHIILDEFYRRPKPGMDGRLDFLKFMFGDIYPEVSEYILGNATSINSISEEDLLKSYNAQFVTENIYISFFSDKKLTKKQIDLINQISKVIPRGERQNFEYKKQVNKFRFRSFFEERSNNIYISLVKLFDIYDGINFDYRMEALISLWKDLIKTRIMDFLRKKHSLIYSGNSFSKNNVCNTTTVGLSIEVSKEVFLKTLNLLHELLHKDIPVFLKSAKGRNWFESAKSIYLFPTNKDIDLDYASIAMLNYSIKNLQNPIFLFDFLQKSIREIDIEEIKDFHNQWLEQGNTFWLESSQKEDEITNVFNKSKFMK